MKTKGFFIRVAVCFVLSLMPANELESLIYSERLAFRGRWMRSTNIVIVESNASIGRRSGEFGRVQSQLLALDPALVLIPSRYNPNDLIVDHDGVVRSAVLQPKGTRPGLAYTAALQLSELRQTPADLRTSYFDLYLWGDLKQPHLINFIGPSGSIPRCPLEAVLRPVGSVAEKGACSDIQGKIVLLSEDEANVPSFHTPLGEMSRTEILANEIHTVVNKKPVKTIGWLERSLTNLALVVLSAFFILYYPILFSAVAIAATGVVVVGVIFQAVFQLTGIYLPSANAAAALLITYLVFSGYKLAFQENLQWKSLKQAQYLRELDRMKTNFLSLVSHDLKTPLARIQAVVERMRRELQLEPQDRSDWRELLESIESSNRELSSYISSILNLSRIESQKVILNKKSNDINVLIQHVLRRLSSVAAQKNITFEESLDPLFSIEFDEDLVRQVITNLVDNAIKYSPPGSKVLIHSREEGEYVRIDVEDFGPGIPKDRLPLLFRKFARFQLPMNEQVKGTGLGLYLSKYFIELHGGKISLKTAEGKGTIFTVLLPLANH